MISVFLFLCGLCAGSFAYVLSVRLFDGRDWVRGRSECESCKKQLRTVDLIPLFSWLSTTGKCRYCKVTLGKAYPLSELITGVIFAGSYYFWPYGFGALGWFQLLLWLVVVVLLVSAAFADYRWSILPDKLTIPLAVIACASQLFSIAYTQSFDAIPGVILGVVVGAGIFYVLNVVSKGAYIGGGDVKLGLFYGILLGSGLKSMLVIAIGSTLGTIALLPMLVRKQKTIHTQIPFGPYLIIATILVYIFGDRLVSLVTTTYLFP